MYMSGVISKEFGYTSTALHICHLDIMLYGVWTWNFEVWMSCHEEVNKLRVGDNVCGAVAFCYPLHNVGTDVHTVYIS
jgi:hypothetical protein